MDPSRRKLYIWAIFLLFLLLAVAALWFAFLREPPAHSDFSYLRLLYPSRLIPGEAAPT